MRRTIGNHERRKENPHVHVLWREGLARRTVPKRREHVHPLERRPHRSKYRLLAKENHQGLERDGLHVIDRQLNLNQRVVNKLGSSILGKSMSPELLHRPRRDGLRTWSTNTRNSRLELGALAERENNKPLANVLAINSNAFTINHKHPQTIAYQHSR